MEPTDEVFHLELKIIHSDVIYYLYGVCNLQLLKTLSLHHYFRLRGGGSDNPNVDEKTGEIPALTNSKFSWNGVPCIDFMERVMMPLENGLQSMSIKGWSLLATVKRRDAGGVLGNPARAVASAVIIAESDSRNEKAFACILNYISRGSYFYRMAYREMNASGIHVYNSMQIFGALPLPPRIVKQREDIWQNISMEALKIPTDQNGFFVYTDFVYEVGRKIQKDGDKQLDKWIDGLPEWFKTEKHSMRHDRDPPSA